MNETEALVVPNDLSDVEVGCDKCEHTAEWFRYGHGCRTGVVCTECRGQLDQRYSRKIDRFGSVRCTRCQTQFYPVDEFVRSSPL